MTVFLSINWQPLQVAMNFVCSFWICQTPISYPCDRSAPELCAKRSLLHTQKEEEAPSSSDSGSGPAKEPTASPNAGPAGDDLEVSSQDGLPAGASVQMT
jgi:hypothetical protein